MAAFDVIPQATADDGWDDAGTWTNDTGYIWLGYWNSNDEEGSTRWPFVPIPKGATITTAYVTADMTNNDLGDNLVLRLSMDDADDSSQISNSTDFQGRTRTTAYTDWTITSSTSTGDIQSPSIVDVVQEVVDRSGWAWGNAMQIFFDVQTRPSNNEDISFADYDWGTDTGVILHVEYTHDAGILQRSSYMEWASTDVTVSGTQGQPDTWSSPTSGNKLVAIHVGDSDITIPTGWTERATQTDGADHIHVLDKVSAGTETSLTIDSDASGDKGLVLIELPSDATYDTAAGDSVLSGTSIASGSTGTLGYDQSISVVGALSWDWGAGITFSNDYYVDANYSNSSTHTYCAFGHKVLTSNSATNTTASWDSSADGSVLLGVYGIPSKGTSLLIFAQIVGG